MGGRGGSSGVSSGSKAASSRMPGLNGSDKQVKWATDIRKQALEAADLVVRNAQKNQRLGLKPDPVVKRPSVGSAQAVRDLVIKQFQGQSSAKAIIDARGNFTQTRMQEAASGLDLRKRQGR